MQSQLGFASRIGIYLSLIITGWFYTNSSALGQQEAPATENAEQPTQINVQEMLEKGEAALKEENFGEAVKIFDELIRGLEQGVGMDPQGRAFARWLAYSGRGRALTGLKEYEAALEDFNRVTDENAEFPPALLGRGKLYLELNAADRALPDFEAAVKTQRTNLEAQFGLGKSYILLNQWQPGVKALTRVLEADPENAEAYRLRGMGYNGLFKLKEASADLQKAISLSPEDYESYFWLGVVHLRNEDYQAAVDEFGRAIEHYKQEPEEEPQPFSQAYLVRSAAYLELGKAANDEAAKTAAYQSAADEAEALLKQLDEKNPLTAGARAQAIYARGVAERMLGELGKAIHSFSEAIRMNPELAEAYFRRGICFHLIGEDKLAISDFVEAANLSYDPDPRANLWEGFTHAKIGNYHEAIRAYGNAIAASDRYTPAYVNRGLAYLAIGEYEKAIADFDDAIRLEPTDANIYFRRGQAYSGLGDYQKASESFASAIRLDKQHAAAHRLMADALQQLGRTEEAKEYRQKADELEPPQQKTN